MYTYLTDEILRDHTPQALFPETFGNAVYYCDVHRAWDDYRYTCPFSIKYVEEGTEHYLLEGTPKTVRAGSYLVINENRQVVSRMSKSQRSHGLTVFLGRELIHEVSAWHHKSLRQLLENPAESGGAYGFYEEVFHYREDPMGQFLKNLFQKRNRWEEIFSDSEELCYALAERLLKSHSRNMWLTGRIDRERESTRKEIFRRVNRGKVMIEDCLFQPVTIGQVAREAAFSKYHFIRLFSDVFGTSPYRYLLQRRIEEARIILETQDIPVTEVAQLTGFADVSAFSKRFKKETGIPPSQARNTGNLAVRTGQGEKERDVNCSAGQAGG